MRRYVWLAALIAGLATAGSPTSAHAQVTPADIDKRIEEQAARLQKMAPSVARVGFVDFTWPADPAEYKALAKHVLVLVSIVAHDEKELPIKRVYIDAAGREIDLHKLGGERSDVPEGAVALLGRHREDYFFLAPAGAMARKGHLRVDFAINRVGFGLYQLPGKPPDFIARDRNADPPRGANPDPKALRALFDREYPGFPVPAELR